MPHILEVFLVVYSLEQMLEKLDINISNKCISHPLDLAIPVMAWPAPGQKDESSLSCCLGWRG